MEYLFALLIAPVLVAIYMIWDLCQVGKKQFTLSDKPVCVWKAKWGSRHDDAQLLDSQVLISGQSLFVCVQPTLQHQPTVISQLHMHVTAGAIGKRIEQVLSSRLTSSVIQIIQQYGMPEAVERTRDCVVWKGCLHNRERVLAISDNHVYLVRTDRFGVHIDVEPRRSQQPADRLRVSTRNRIWDLRWKHRQKPRRMETDVLEPHERLLVRQTGHPDWPVLVMYLVEEYFVSTEKHFFLVNDAAQVMVPILENHELATFASDLSRHEYRFTMAMDRARWCTMTHTNQLVTLDEHGTEWTWNVAADQPYGMLPCSFGPSMIMWTLHNHLLSLQLPVSHRRSQEETKQSTAAQLSIDMDELSQSHMNELFLY